MIQRRLRFTSTSWHREYGPRSSVRYISFARHEGKETPKDGKDTVIYSLSLGNRRREGATAGDNLDIYVSELLFGSIQHFSISSGEVEQIICAFQVEACVGNYLICNPQAFSKINFIMTGSAWSFLCPWVLVERAHVHPDPSLGIP